MASIKISHIFVAFVLSAVVLIVSSAPSTLDNSLIVGKRQPGDYLAKNIVYQFSGEKLPPQIKRRILLKPGEVITQVKLAAVQSDAKVSIADGGPGQQFVVVLVESSTNTIKLTVQIYAMDTGNQLE